MVEVGITIYKKGEPRRISVAGCREGSLLYQANL